MLMISKYVMVLYNFSYCKFSIAAYCFTTLHKNITQHQYKILMNYLHNMY